MPVELYAALVKDAQVQQCSCSDYIQQLLERTLDKKVSKQLNTDTGPAVETNLISAKEYGQLHGRSREQVKAYLAQHDRIPGIKIGRDWVIPGDAKFSEDKREGAGRY